MKLEFNTLDEIFQTILRNKTRSVLTAFGIFWGIFMLVLLMGGGLGLQRLLYKNFEGFASNSAFIAGNVTSKPYKGFDKGREIHFNNGDEQIIKRAIPGLKVITPLAAQFGKNPEAGKRKYEGATLKGMYPIYQEIENPEIGVGRYINDVDVQLIRKVCVLGKKVAQSLFPGVPNPCGRHIMIDGISYQVVGVSYSNRKMSVMGPNQSSIIVPFTTEQQVYNQGNKYAMLCFTGYSGESMEKLTKEVESEAKKLHYVNPNDGQAFFKINMEVMFKMVDNLFRGIRILIWLIGIGTLVAGAIGVSNIMMVTVAERTVELGIRRAIGARPRSIVIQVMTESIVLTIIAGLFGIMLAVGILHIIETVTYKSTQIDVSFQISFIMAIGSALFLALLGGLAGLMPTFRALSIKPVDAMRDE